MRPAQARVLGRLGSFTLSRGIYLAGGTAIALRLGHRRSVDLDFFSQELIADPLEVVGSLARDGIPFTVGSVSRGTLHGAVGSVRVSFLDYPYRLLQPPTPLPDFNCQVASLDDLACMKLSAIVQRGTRRDFIDLVALIRAHRPLGELLDLYREKYGLHDVTHLLYALTYFDDADKERSPIMRWDLDWRTVKRTVRQSVLDLAR